MNERRKGGREKYGKKQRNKGDMRGDEKKTFSFGGCFQSYESNVLVRGLSNMLDRWHKDWSLAHQVFDLWSNIFVNSLYPKIPGSRTHDPSLSTTLHTATVSTF
jgi:hypothetical protein